MKIIKSKDLKFIPASHEDQANPEVWKKVLFKKEDLSEGRIQMINWAKLPPGNTFKPHYHEDMDEIFIILNGKAAIKVMDKEAILEKGDAVLIPMREVHQMTNLGKEDVYYLVIGISHGQGGKTIVTE